MKINVTVRTALAGKVSLGYKPRIFTPPPLLSHLEEAISQTQIPFFSSQTGNCVWKWQARISDLLVVKWPSGVIGGVGGRLCMCTPLICQWLNTPWLLPGAAFSSADATVKHTVLQSASAAPNGAAVKMSFVECNGNLEVTNTCRGRSNLIRKGKIF